ncbi:MAG: hypothetical protein JXO22_17355 [Phycisphaerae bacterium]|nr:hypothetical protein [Phycisphaerae bacterium]
MTTGTPTVKSPARTNLGATIPFDAIDDAGAYICNWTGHLLRVPEDGITRGHAPLINIIGTEPLTVTKISDNPFITISKAKAAATSYHLTPNF